MSDEKREFYKGYEIEVGLDLMWEVCLHEGGQSKVIALCDEEEWADRIVKVLSNGPPSMFTQTLYTEAALDEDKDGDS